MAAPVLVEDLRQLPGELNCAGRLFSFHAGGQLRDLLKMTLAEAGVVLPRRGALHVFCHTWATWMRRRGGLDTLDLVRRWADPEISRQVRACGGQRTGVVGGPAARREKEGGVIRGKSVDS